MFSRTEGAAMIRSSFLSSGRKRDAIPVRLLWPRCQISRVCGLRPINAVPLSRSFITKRITSRRFQPSGSSASQRAGDLAGARPGSERLLSFPFCAIFERQQVCHLNNVRGTLWRVGQPAPRHVLSSSICGSSRVSRRATTGCPLRELIRPGDLIDLIEVVSDKESG